jgi:hypothetical protein
MVIKKIFLVLMIIFFSGCTYIKNNIDNEIILTLTGELKINEEKIFKKEYFLKNQSITLSSELNLENYINKEVIVKGIMKTSNIEKGKDLNIKVVDIALLNTDWTKEILNKLSISFNKPYFLKIINKEDRSVIYKNNEIFYVIKKSINKEWQEKFLNEGNEIKIQGLSLYRLRSGNQFLFYIPQYSIEIDYWGDSNNMHLFYELIKSINIEESEKSIINNINNNIIEKPNVLHILYSLYLNKDTSINIDPKKIINISIFKDFLEITYFTKKDILSKELYSFDWDLMLLEKINFNHIITWNKLKSLNWEKISGNIPKDKEIKEFFNYNSKYSKKRENTKIIYFSSLYNFSIEYPDKMYYTKIEKSDNILVSLGFSFVPFYNFFYIDPEIIVSIKKGKKEKREDYILKNIILIPKSNNEYIELKTKNSSLFYIIQDMADSITLYN